MPFLKAAFFFFILGSNGPLLCPGEVLAHQQANRASKQPTAVQTLIPAGPVHGKTIGMQEDRKLLAQKLVAEGKQFQSQGNAESLRKALESYEKALEIWRSLADRRAEAETLSQIGVVHYLLDQ